MWFYFTGRVNRADQYAGGVWAKCLGRLTHEGGVAHAHGEVTRPTGFEPVTSRVQSGELYLTFTA